MSAPVPNDLLDADDDDRLIRLAHQQRLTLTPPSQSNFRVVAILFYEIEPSNQTTRSETTSTIAVDDIVASPITSSSAAASRHYVIGTNGEPGGNIGGSICAERSAMLQLRFVPNLRRITKLVISTDALNPIAPGMMCREFLSGSPKVPRDLPIVLAGSKCHNCSLNLSFPDNERFSSSEEAMAPLHASCRRLSQTTDHDESFKFHSFHVIRTTLEQLYPYPSLYAHLTAHDASRLASQLESKRDAKEQTPLVETSRSTADSTTSLLLMGLATRAAHRQHERDRIERPEFLHYPITYGAAVLFDDGSMVSACQKKALEYGCTLDAVCQLAGVMDGDDDYNGKLSKLPTLDELPSALRRKRMPILLVHVDQYGVVHAPFAPARAFLSEHGYGQCRVLLQSNESNLIGDAEEIGPTADFIEVPASDLAPLAPDNSCHS